MVIERAERIGQMSSEIRERAGIEFDARDEVKRIAARKDRERAARLRAQQAGGQGSGGSSTGSGSAGSGSTGSSAPPPPPR